MTFQPGANVYTQGFGSRPENVEVPHIDVRAPTTTDILYPVGKKWVDRIGNATYELTSFSASGNVTIANWQTASGGSGALSTLTGNSGTATPTAGNIQIAGTVGQLVATAAGSTVTLSFPSPVLFPGSVTVSGLLQGGADINAGTTLGAAGNITSNAGNLVATNGNLVLGTAGNKINITEGANASLGQATLSGGTVTVSTTAVTANSRIFISRASIGATGAAATGKLVTGTVTPATSFVINAVQAADATALQATDVSVVNWWIIN